jgi:hypothetical protein
MGAVLEISKAIQYAQACRSLQEGWDSGKGGPVSESVVTKAVTWLQSAKSCGIEFAGVFPGSRREISLCFLKGPLIMGLSIESDGSVIYELENGKTPIETRTVTDSDRKHLLSSFHQA